MATGARILIVDDEELVLVSLSEFLRLEGHAVETAKTVREAAARLAAGTFHLIIADVSMPEADGFELLKMVRNRYRAADYLTKPIRDEEIKVRIEKVLAQQSLTAEVRTLKNQLAERYSLDNILGRDYKMLKVFDLVESVADTPTTVLVTGESGTGKSMIARAIHHRSNRRAGPFIEVACGALPETLLESELFGHVKGAFTGAVGDKPGKFKQADGGTIFLDEISTATPALQVKLLRVLQEFEFEPVGGSKTEHADIRCILATNQDLATAVREGKFRQDLYYRVNVVAVHLSPLRERLGDIPLLAEHFLKRHCERTGRNVVGFQEEAIRTLQMFNWPGNVRQLENVIERAVILTKTPTIGVVDLPEEIREPRGDADGNGFGLPLKKALQSPEKELIVRALKANQGSRQATAQALGINRTTLYKKMKRYGIEEE
ncbi:MAG: sigma-54 dependent transcriptional regulator [Planctomycetota bacterium]|nr:sigma-54 dependent transcriptional regulator [Planctomycetota bacterium]